MCVIATTRLVCENGITKSAEDIILGDKVYTSDGTLQEVKKIVVYEIQEPLVLLKGWCGEPNGTTLTLDHNIIGEKNRIINPAIFPKYYYWSMDANPEGKLIDIPVSELKKKDWAFVPKIKIDEIERPRFTLTKTRFIEVDEDFAYVFGKFISYGWIKGDDIFFEFKKEEGIELGYEWLSKNKFSPKKVLLNRKHAGRARKIDNNRYCLVVNNKYLYSFLKSFGEFNNRNNTSNNIISREEHLNKKVPEFIIKSDIKIVDAFIRVVTSNDYETYFHVEHGSRKFVDGLRLLFNRLGICKTQGYKKRDRLWRLQSNFRFWVTDEGFYVRIRSIEKLPIQNTKAYDFRIGNNSYLTSCFTLKSSL